MMSSTKKSQNLVYLIDLLKRLVDFIEPYKPLLNTHNVEFITGNQWEDKSLLSDELRVDLDRLIDASDRVVNIVKLFKEFNIHESKTSDYADLENLFRQIKLFMNEWDQNVITDANTFLFDYIKNTQLEDSPLDYLQQYQADIERKFAVMQKQNRFMNEKKSYEVDLMSKFVALLCKKLHIDTIVDIGSGKAYLSAQLTSSVFDNRFNVIAIDSSQNNVQSSLKRLLVMKRKTTIFTTPEVDAATNQFKTFSQFIQSSTQLSNLVQEHCPAEQNTSMNQFALVGLHSCGNLSNSIINLYLSNVDDDALKNANNTNNNRAKLLCNVSCCYNLLNEKYANDTESSRDFKKTNVQVDECSKFPMSIYLNEIKYSLSFNVRMLACHSLDRCFQSVDDFKELNNVSLWYRCVLQVILLENYSECLLPGGENDQNDAAQLSNLQVGRKLIKEKNSQKPSFCDYVRKALGKLALDNQKTISDEEIDGYLSKHKSAKTRFDVYLQLKLIISPLVEYIILLDRLVYLFEIAAHGHKPTYSNHLIRLFDSSKSPRSHALVSYII